MPFEASKKANNKAYLIFVIFFTQAKFLENKIYTEKRQFLPISANLHRNLHRKTPIFRVKSVKIYTSQKNFTRVYPWRPWQILGMSTIKSTSTVKSISTIQSSSTIKSTLTSTLHSLCRPYFWRHDMKTAAPSQSESESERWVSNLWCLPLSSELWEDIRTFERFSRKSKSENFTK